MSPGDIPQGCILVASSAKEEARLIASLLREDFSQVRISTDERAAAEDFDAHRPQLLVLAFRTVAEAERYYLGLYRLSDQIHAVPHRTLILCDRSETPRVFELCQRQQFDDYVIFWPLSHDPYRLRMAASHALRAVQNSVDPTAQQFAAHARQMGVLKGEVEQQLAQGSQQARQVAAMLRHAEHGIHASVRELSSRFESGAYAAFVDVKDKHALRGELSRFGEQEVRAPLAQLGKALQPVQEWVVRFGDRVGPSLQSVQALADMAARLAPKVLLVDDDVFQHKLVEQQLHGFRFQLMRATNASTALSLIRSRRPDVVILDFNLPDMSGAELLKKLKSADETRDIPVIMITGATTKDVVVECHRAGAVEVIAKPIEPSRLLPSIERSLVASGAAPGR